MAAAAENARGTVSANKTLQPKDDIRSTGRRADRRHLPELLQRPWTIVLALAIPLTAAYLIVAPPAGDLAAATYRSDLFARVGFTTWDTGWYAAHGHWLPAYSLLSPDLGALLGVRPLLALSASPPRSCSP